MHGRVNESLPNQRGAMGIFWAADLLPLGTEKFRTTKAAVG